MSFLDKLYPAVKIENVTKTETIVSFPTPAPKKIKTKEELYVPVGEDLNISYIAEHKPPKKVIIDYLRMKVEELDEDSD